jgi:transcriptional regulator with XRE-family HTH domain
VRNPPFKLDQGMVDGLTARRLRLGLTQKELAARMGTRQSAVSDLESGRHTPTLGTLDRWTRSLGLRLLVGTGLGGTDG